MSPIERSGGIGGAAAGGLVKLFESVLGASAASIDTGANGIAAGHNDLIIMLNTRTDAVVVNADVRGQFNGDTGANYDVAWVRNSAGAIGAVDAHGTTFIAPAQCAGATIAANYFAAATINIPKYANTTTFKSMISLSGPTGDITANDQIIFATNLWRSTVAINQLKIFPSVGSFIAGSSMTIYGTQ